MRDKLQEILLKKLQKFAMRAFSRAFSIDKNSFPSYHFKIAISNYFICK